VGSLICCCLIQGSDVFVVVKGGGPVYPNFGAARQGQKRKRGGDSSNLVESDQSVGVLVYS
jgi:hypothetical protein